MTIDPLHQGKRTKELIINPLHKKRLLFLIGLFPLYLVFVVLVFGKNVPFWDQWDFIPLLDIMYKGQDVLPTLLSKQFNEHRLVFPNLIMLGMARLTHWHIGVELAINLLLASLIFAVLCRAAYRQFGQPEAQEPIDRHPLLLYGLLSALTFSMSQTENWMWGWQLQIFLNVLATGTGFYCLARRNSRNPLNLFAALACGILATYSFANGLLFWPVALVLLVVQAVQRQRSWVAVLFWAACTVAVFVLYFTNWHPVNHNSSSRYFLSHPLDSVLYLTAYLGAPLFQFSQAVFVSVLAGLAGLIIGFIFFQRLYRNSLLLQPPFLFWHALLLYALASDGITAVGRVGLGVLQAISGRYTTIGNLFWVWIVAVGYALFASGHLSFTRLWKGTALGLAALMLIMLPKSTYSFWKRNRELTQVAQELRKPKPDPSVVILAYPEPDSLKTRIETLQKYRLSFFSERP